MATIAEGDSSYIPDVQLSPGQSYTLTLTLPFSPPDWVRNAVYQGLRAIGLNVTGISMSGNMLWIDFAT